MQVLVTYSNIYFYIACAKAKINSIMAMYKQIINNLIKTKFQP